MANERTSGGTASGAKSRSRAEPASSSRAAGSSRGGSAPRARSEDGKRAGDGESAARGMGWFSLALGATELAAPRAFARFIGAPETPSLTRLLGIREIARGIGSRR